MNGFRYDGVLFYKAQQNLSSALNLLENNRSNISKCKDSISTVFEYKSQVSEICNNLLFLISDVSTLSRNVSEAKERLISLDSVFAMQYYESASNKFDSLHGRLTQEEKNIIQYNQEQYQKNLCKYLEGLESQGFLNEEQKKVYEQVKLSLYVTSLSRELEKLDPNSQEYKNKQKWLDSNYQKLLNLQIKELESKGNLTEEEQKQLNSLKDNVKALELDKLQLELEEVNNNPVEMPGVSGGRMTEAQAKAYRKEAEKYGKYYQKKLELENKIESLQKELGVYENKWYEDIGDAITKTGSAWKNAWETKSFDAVVSATKQTLATGAVVANSAFNGLIKVGELVIDGAVIAGGTIGAGATWLFHDTWSDNELAGNVMDSSLDFVRRDLVGEANQNFYENTSLGKWINENSNLKYDSTGAQAIQSAGEFVGKIAIATAATIVSGGAAAPIVIGALYGAGNTGEKYTQSVDRNNGESYNYAKALLKSTAGAVAGAAEFYGYGQMGAGMLGVNISPQASTSFVKNFLIKDTLMDSISVVTDHGVNVAFGDETWQYALLYGGAEFALALGMNAIGARQSTKSARAVEAAEDASRVVKQFDEFDISRAQPKAPSKALNTNDIYDSFNIMRKKFGETEAIARIREALTTGKYNLITRDGNARQILSNLNINDFNLSLSSIKMNEAYNGLLSRYGSEFKLDRRIQKIVNSKNWNYLDNSKGLVSDLYKYTGGNLDNLEHFLITKKLSKYSDFKLMGTEIAKVGDPSPRVNMTKKLNFYKIYDSNINAYIYVQKNLDYHKDLNSVLNALDDMKRTSPKLASSIDSLYITDIRCPSDPYWSKIHKCNFYSAALGGNGNIQMFSPLTNDCILETIYHESGHNIDKIIYDYTTQSYTRSISDSFEWQNAVQNDYNWASPYARESYYSRTKGRFCEDFADSVSNLKIMGAKKFNKKYPNRAKILHIVLPELFN